MAVSTKPNSGYTRTSPFKRDAEKLRKFQEEIGIHMNNSLSYLFFSFLFCLLSEIQANWGLSIAQSYLKHYLVQGMQNQIEFSCRAANDLKNYTVFNSFEKVHVHIP